MLHSRVPSQLPATAWGRGLYLREASWCQTALQRLELSLAYRLMSFRALKLSLNFKDVTFRSFYVSKNVVSIYILLTKTRQVLPEEILFSPFSDFWSLLIFVLEF